MAMQTDNVFERASWYMWVGNNALFLAMFFTVGPWGYPFLLVPAVLMIAGGGPQWRWDKNDERYMGTFFINGAGTLFIFAVCDDWSRWGALTLAIYCGVLFLIQLRRQQQRRAG
jgi:hypothetical protein